MEMARKTPKIVVWAAASVVWAPVVATDLGQEPPLRREAPDDPPLPPPPALRGVPSPPPVFEPGVPLGGVQVNVDETGANIEGDAANEPSIAVDPTAPNRITIGWRQFDNVQSNFRQAGWAYSDDGGRTWTFPGVIEPGIFRSDPVLDADADGNFYYMSLTIVGNDFVCDLFKSQDGGVSWDDGVPAFGGDKEWIGIDRTDGIGRGNIYHIWSPFFSCCDGFFTRSTDGGQSFMEPMVLPADLFWGTVSVGPDGALYICGLDNSFTPALVRSSNAQDPKQKPFFELTSNVDLGGSIVQGGGPNPAGLLGQMWVATDHSRGPTHGNVYVLASVDPPGPDPLDVMFAASSDGGLSWTKPVRVNDDPPQNNAWQWFGTMSVAPDGRIDVIFNDTRNSGVDNVSELFYASSADGGANWSANIAVSPPFDSHVGWPNQNKIGDYYDMVSDRAGAHVAYATTFNNEQDVYYLRIGDYDCNDNGVPDTEDLGRGTSLDCNENEIPDECDIAAGLVPDCNVNGIPDECDIADGTVPDKNRDGIPDECECPWDLDDSGSVGVGDLLLLFAEWGTDPGGPPDFDHSGRVGVEDLLAMFANWGACE